jgi:hypothetical protein
VTAFVLLCLAANAKSAVSRPALDELAVRVVEQAEGARPEPPVAVFVEGAPPVLVRAFASALSSELATRRRAPTVLEVTSATDAEAQARAHDLRTLLRLSIQLEAGKLTARGDAIHTWVNFWSGAESSRSGPATALFASVDADPQALALAAATPPQTPAAGPLKLALTSLARLPSVPLALAVGDVDGDGKSEIAVLLDDGLVVLDADGRVRWRSDLKDLPPAASPPREPFGAVAVLVSPPRIALASGRHARGEVLTVKGSELKGVAAEHPVAVDGVPVRVAPGLNVFEKVAGSPAPFTALSVRSGVRLTVFPDGTASLWRGAEAGRLNGAGAASTLADLDGDGTPEVFLSSTRFFPDGDPLRVVSLASAEAQQPGPSALWEGSTPRGRALVATAADLDGDRSEEVLLGVWLSDGTGELLVARRIADK